jgi:hypothetical protein
MKIAIVGSKDYTDYARMVKLLGAFGLDNDGNVIVSSGEKGAATLAKSFAEDSGLVYKEFSPDKKKNGAGAHLIAMKELISNADFVVAFWDGQSKGSENALSEAHELKKPTLIFYH